MIAAQLSGVKFVGITKERLKKTEFTRLHAYDDIQSLPRAVVFYVPSQRSANSEKSERVLNEVAALAKNEFLEYLRHLGDWQVDTNKYLQKLKKFRKKTFPKTLPQLEKD